MKILITVGIYPPDIGGPASFVPKIANLLSQNNYEVTVICLSDSNLKDNETYKVKRILRNQNLLIRWLKTIILIILNKYDSPIQNETVGWLIVRNIDYSHLLLYILMAVAEKRLKIN